jgi:hypothetical protein
MGIRAGWNPRWWALLAALAFALTLVAGDAEAQKRRRRSKRKPKPAPAAPAPTPTKSPAPSSGDAEGPAPRKKMTELDFTGLNLAGRLRTPQLLYFLERASAELEAASLERRSFVPEMIRSMDEESL